MIRLANRGAGNDMKVYKDQGQGKREYATENNSGKVDSVVSRRTQSAIDRCSGVAWSPAMEDAVLTGLATRLNHAGETVPVISGNAKHRSHGNVYDQTAISAHATRMRLRESADEEAEADEWAMSQAD